MKSSVSPVAVCFALLASLLSLTAGARVHACAHHDPVASAGVMEHSAHGHAHHADHADIDTASSDDERCACAESCHAPQAALAVMVPPGMRANAEDAPARLNPARLPAHPLPLLRPPTPLIA